jgi:hypothetical protein
VLRELVAQAALILSNHSGYRNVFIVTAILIVRRGGIRHPLGHPPATFFKLTQLPGRRKQLFCNGLRICGTKIPLMFALTIVMIIAMSIAIKKDAEPVLIGPHATRQTQ